MIKIKSVANTEINFFWGGGAAVMSSKAQLQSLSDRQIQLGDRKIVLT